MTDLPTLLAVWAVVAFGAWVQVLAGFALGLFLMGAVTLFGLMPVALAAQVTSILVIFNAVMILSRDWRHTDRPALRLLLTAAIPGSVLGYAVMEYLSGESLDMLRLLLGLLIAGAALQLVRRPEPLAARSGPLGFLLSGGAGGIMGGMFATAGPPVIWQLYRQPIAQHTVRVTLVAFFFVTQAWRLVLAGATTGIAVPTLIAAAGAIPAVVLGTWLAQRFPPPLAPLTLRRAALALLFLNGVALIATAIARMI
ncbi:MAG: TSUP family transporter [Paracoccus sp. (in: a-proteobacteria)]|uniref:TSUP family transporter n=1 Tax=Paracoccus sp. TaxID=267 RepID=UPI0026E03647|nr:TSUP family transporter [Paracoccus sp. (in: a-proteobacteria)]MDO5622153.1 TSUP family transporter [Paracoccus sp. (in: a-proteobacteria)]